MGCGETRLDVSVLLDLQVDLMGFISQFGEFVVECWVLYLIVDVLDVLVYFSTFVVDLAVGLLVVFNHGEDFVILVLHGELNGLWCNVVAFLLEMLVD